MSRRPKTEKEKREEYFKTINDNVNKIRKIYETNDEQDLLVIVDKEYVDPDKKYRVVRCRNGFSYELSADGICSWKKLMENSKGDSWIDDYLTIRSKEIFWSVHNVPTINTLRRSCFDDRIDFTLYDISCFFKYKEEYMRAFEGLSKEMMYEKYEKEYSDKHNLKLWKAYFNPKGKTYEWLMSFENFKEFIDDNKLNEFVDGAYEVYNLDTRPLTTIRCREEYKTSNKEYLKTLVTLIRRAKIRTSGSI